MHKGTVLFSYAYFIMNGLLFIGKFVTIYIVLSVDGHLTIMYDKHDLPRTQIIESLSLHRKVDSEVIDY